MSIYVDESREYKSAHLPYRDWCHMFADSLAELDAAAVELGLKPEWRQKAGTALVHYDLTPSKRARAIECGATEVTVREGVALCLAKAAREARR